MKVLGTLDDDEMMVGATDTWPWTCYILAEVPDRSAVASDLQSHAADRNWRRSSVEVLEDRGASRPSALLRRAAMSAGPDGSVAVVTGAGQGLGEAIAMRLSQDGYHVVFADVNSRLPRARPERPMRPNERAAAHDLDVRDLASVQGCLDFAVDRWGHVDVWVNNAARTVARSFLEIDPDEWDDVLATNLRGTYFGCRVAGIHMCGRETGRIVNLASVAGQWGRGLTGAHYAASKAGIVSLTRSAAMAFAAHGVTVNAVAPGCHRWARRCGDARRHDRDLRQDDSRREARQAGGGGRPRRVSRLSRGDLHDRGDVRRQRRPLDALAEASAAASV